MSDEELIVAAFLDDFSTPVGDKKASTPQGQINLVKEILTKDNLPAKKIPTDEYLNGLHKNGNYYAIANNLSTSNYSEFNLMVIATRSLKNMVVAVYYKPSTCLNLKL
ncbi:MAG: hypothetical protein ACI4TY_03470 [Candidatus Limosilactobacillus intestinavium]